MSVLTKCNFRVFLLALVVGCSKEVPTTNTTSRAAAPREPTASSQPTQPQKPVASTEATPPPKPIATSQPAVPQKLLASPQPTASRESEKKQIPDATAKKAAPTNGDLLPSASELPANSTLNLVKHIIPFHEKHRINERDKTTGK